MHTKAVFFERSGRLLLGSQNLYSATSTFSETMVEFVVPPETCEAVLQEIFRSLPSNPIVPVYDISDIRIHGDEPRRGKPYLPCHREVAFWDLAARVLGTDLKPPKQEFLRPGWIYMIYRYECDGRPVYLCFDRGYTYCGDLTAEAAEWLISQCVVTERRSHGLVPSTASDLLPSSPVKDRVFAYHPIAKMQRAREGIWLSGMRDVEQHRDRIETIPPINITYRKFRK